MSPPELPNWEMESCVELTKTQIRPAPRNFYTNYWMHVEFLSWYFIIELVKNTTGLPRIISQSLETIEYKHA